MSALQVIRWAYHTTLYTFTTISYVRLRHVSSRASYSRVKELDPDIISGLDERERLVLYVARFTTISGSP